MSTGEATQQQVSVSLSVYWDMILKYVGPLRLHVLWMAVFILGETGLLLVVPLILRRFIDAARSGSETSVLITIAAIFAGAAIFQHLVGLLSTYFIERVGWTSTNNLRADLARHTLSLDMSFHHKRTPGEMIERVDGDVTALGKFFSSFLITAISSILLILGILGILYAVEWRAGLGVTVFAAVAMSTLLGIRKIAVPAYEAARQSWADLFGFVEERLGGTEDIRSLNAREHTMFGLHRLTQPWFRTNFKARMVFVVFWNTIQTLGGLSMIVGLGLGAYLFLGGWISLGTVYLVYQYSRMLTQPMDNLTRDADALQQATASISRIGELVQTEPKVRDGPGADIPLGPLAVQFDNVTFSYNEVDDVLKNVSFELQPGRTLGLIGRTGSGKTTMTRLMFRFYDPQSGVVRLAGKDIREGSLEALRQRIGLVTQTVRLFHGNVRDNLTFFNREVPDERTLEVIRELGLRRWYESLPEGLDTILKEGGGLSAGEAQLLAFARVFLRQMDLVILDEASSRLDRHTEALIENAVDKLVGGRTVIIIAHHLSTIRRCDEILLLEDGRILEKGDRSKLASDAGSRFHGLLQAGLEEVLA